MWHKYFLCTLLLLCGCGGERGPELAVVEGIVTYQGKPLRDANVVFISDNGPLAYGISDELGRFELATRGNDGAVTGHGCITVVAVKQMFEGDPEKMTSSQLKKMFVSVIPERYSRVETSGLTFDVNPKEKNVLTLDLTD